MAVSRIQLNVKGKGIEVTEALRRHAEKGTDHVVRLFRPNVEIRVEVMLSLVREVHIAEVTAFVEGLILRGESRTNDLYASVDDAFAKIERQAKRYKGRLVDRKHGGRTPEKLAQVLAEHVPASAEDAPEAVVVRTKRIVVKPMDVHEAIMQMELVGHDFFVFVDEQTESVNVVYRRQDGTYGVLETEG